jgi:hypothetical protein
MKLLLCLDCDDIFNLGYEIKSCNCGATKGKYIDQRNAIYSGVNAIPLGFANNSFANAIRNQSVDEFFGERFEAFVVPKICETFIKKDNLNE